MRLRLLEMENEVNEIIAMFDVEVSERVCFDGGNPSFAILTKDVKTCTILVDEIADRKYAENIAQELREVKNKIQYMNLHDTYEYVNLNYYQNIKRQQLISNYALRIAHYNEFGHEYYKDNR